MKTIEELEKIYDLELDRIISGINNLPSRCGAKVTRKKKAKLVLLQFPDGLKVYATAVVDYLEEKVNARFLIWFGSCFGACDTPGCFSYTAYSKIAGIRRFFFTFIASITPASSSI